MSLDWMKIEKSTPNKPEIRKIASELGISRQDAFGRCFEVWCYFDDNSTDGHVLFADRPTVDDIAELHGFALAMLHVGWLVERKGAISLPNFDRHNGQTAKQRSLAARRQVKIRSRQDALSSKGSAPSATETPCEAQAKGRINPSGRRRKREYGSTSQEAEEVRQRRKSLRGKDSED